MRFSEYAESGDDVDDDGHRKGNGQPAVGLRIHLFQFNGTPHDF